MSIHTHTHTHIYIYIYKYIYIYIYMYKQKMHDINLIENVYRNASNQNLYLKVRNLN